MQLLRSSTILGNFQACLSLILDLAELSDKKTLEKEFDGWPLGGTKHDGMSVHCLSIERVFRTWLALYLSRDRHALSIKTSFFFSVREPRLAYLVFGCEGARPKLLMHGTHGWKIKEPNTKSHKQRRKR